MIAVALQSVLIRILELLLAGIITTVGKISASDHKLPGSAEIWIFVQPSFLPKLTQLSILNEYQHLLGANLWWIN